jgi:multiple sugar transport system substrate-binding protein
MKSRLKIRTLASLALAITIPVLSLSGCSISTNETPKDEPVQKQTEKVKYWVWLDDPKDTTLAQMVQEFNSTHTDVNVEMEVIAWNDFRTKLLTTVAGGGSPDAASFKLTWIPEFVGNDALEPLDSYISNWSGKSDIVDNLWDVMKVSDDKKTYAMPWIVQALYMYYRPSMFKAAGVNIPKTWDEFLNVAQKLTVDKNGDGKIDQYAFGMRGARYGHEPWGSFIFSNVQGNKIMENGKVVFNTAEAKQANELYLDLFKKYKVVPPTAPSDGFAEIIANFKAGKTAMVVHHIRSSKEMMDTFGDDVSAFVVPEGKYGRWTSLGDTENVVFKNSANKKGAFTFISWLAEKNQNDKWCRASGNVPVCKSVQELDYYKNNRFMKVSFDSMPYAHVYPVNTAMGDWIENLWPATTQEALLGKITGEQMMNKLEEAMTKK